MGGLAVYITETGRPDANRIRLLQALPTAEGETAHFCIEGAATVLYAGENSPITQRRGNHTLTAVLTGNLSNSAALRGQLQRRGHPVYTECDTELLLISYIEWGRSAPEHFSGDFALVIWDGDELFSARSPSGRKSLYYTCLDGFPFFASDPAVLFAHPGLSLRLRPQDAVKLLCPTESTVSEPLLPEGIESLPPGAFFLWQKDSGKGVAKGVFNTEKSFPDGDFSADFGKRLRTFLTANENLAECFLSLRENDPLAEWLCTQDGGTAKCRKLAIWEERDSICPDATTITGEEAALGLTDPVTALGRVDFTLDEAAAFRLCQKVRKSFSSAVSAAGGYLLLTGRPQQLVALPPEWLVPELREIAGIPMAQESTERLLQKNLQALFERNDRLASHAGLRPIFPFADPELQHLCRNAPRQAFPELPDTPPSPRFWPHPDGRGWAHGIESRFRALLARADAPIWKLCRCEALLSGRVSPDKMAKLVTAGHWLEHFRIAPF